MRNSAKVTSNYFQVWNVLLRTLRDVKDSFRVRIAAAQVILDGHISVEILEQIGQLLTSEKNSQVRHYIFSAIKTIAVSHNPCNRNV